MKNNSYFKNYLIIGTKYFRICVFHKSENKVIYDNKTLINNYHNQIDYDELDNFLENNVFKIERKLNFFLKNIVLIIENDIFLKLQISVKKNYYDGKIEKDDLSYLLNEAKSLTKKSLEGQKISHMFIEKYQIDKNDYTFFPDNLKGNHFSLDVCFITFSDKLAKEIEKVLRKYQILWIKTISSNYINNLYPENNLNVLELIRKLQEGINKNEVKLATKNPSKSGLFEKFFHLFS